MPAFARTSKPVPANVSRSEFWQDAGLQAQGDTGRSLRAHARRAIEHWAQRTATLVAPDNSDEFSYVSVPPNRAFLVKTRYVFGGRGKPLPLRLDVE